MLNGTDSVTVDFLVYTRSKSFDYQWVYGLEDKALEDKLQRHVVDWLNTGLLAKLPPVTTFFKLENYHALMIARASGDRVDKEDRTIFERALFLWKPVDGLNYEHLYPLSVNLQEEAAKVYTSLPNNEVRYQPKTRQFTYRLKDLDAETASLTEDCWDLPDSLTPVDLIRQRLTVEVPQSWSFHKMLGALVDQPISPAGIVYIGNALPFDQRSPADGSWMVSAQRDEDDTPRPRILSPNGQRPLAVAVGAGVSNDAQKPATGEARASNSYSTDQPPNGLGARAGRETASDGSAVKTQHDAQPTKTPEAINSAAAAEMEQLFKEAGQASRRQDKDSGGDLGRLMKRMRVWEQSQSPLINAERKLLLLLTPIIPSSLSHLLVLWNNLLMELLLPITQPTRGMHEEWIRRLENLQSITIQNLTPPSGAWESEFTEVCFSLRRILEGH